MNERNKRLIGRSGQNGQIARAKCFVEFVHSPPGTPVPAALLEVDDAGNWAVPWPPVSDEEAGAAVPSATASDAADPQGLLVFSGCEGVLAEEETADAGAVSCSGCEGDFAAGARGMSVAGGMPLSWKWRKKLVGWITITISGCDGDVSTASRLARWASSRQLTAPRAA